MGKVRMLWTVALALTATSVSQAAVLVATDFSKNSTGWVLNGTSKIADFANSSVPKGLQLTSDEGNQYALTLTDQAFKVTQFSFTADVRIGHDPNTSACPADGFAMAAACAEKDQDALSDQGGTGLGIFGLDTFTALEVNTWRGNGLGTDEEKADCVSGKNETFAIDVINPNTETSRAAGGGTPDAGGPKIGQTLPPSGFKVVNGGFYRYHWTVAANGDTQVFATGLDAGKNDQFKSVKILDVKGIKNAVPTCNNMRFTMSAGTGGAYQTTEIRQVRITDTVDPMPTGPDLTAP
jgi:hypothetical protein